MTNGSLKDLYLEELSDLYDAETQAIRTLPRLRDAARTPELREALTRRCEEARLHLERLQLIFTRWGERRPSRTSLGLTAIVQEADARLNHHATGEAREAAVIGAAERIEHYEMAAYASARACARRLNRPDEARLLEETINDIGRADRRLTEIVDAPIEAPDRPEAALVEARPDRTATPPHGDKLR